LRSKHGDRCIFDTVIDRRSRHSTKWLAVKEGSTPENASVIPLWIADMDFRSPPQVLSAMQQAVEHGILGYREWPEDFFSLFCHWQSSRHGWEIDPEWVVPCQSVITAMELIIRTLSEPDDEIIILSPGFGTFNRVIHHTGRRLVDVPLVEQDRQYGLDISRIEAQISPRSRILILCNPHNPIGKVWNKQELAQIGDLCQRHGLLLLSDDVHQDLVIGERPYTPIMLLNDKVADFCITFTSPCKTFNLGGLPVTHLVIKNDAIRSRIRHELYQLSVHKPNSLGMSACDAAYREGEPWLDELLGYLKANYALLKQGLNAGSSIRLFHTEGSYLAWLDFRRAGLTQPELEHRLLHQAGLLLESGLNFGPTGQGFMRLNFALPKSELETVIERLRHYFPA
jgi:cystathionine beta-lyase